MACIDLQHRTCLFSGRPREALLETAEKGENRIFVHGVRPLVDGAPAISSVLYRNFLSQKPKTKECGTASRLDGISYTRVSTRYARVWVRIPAGSDWDHAQGAELYFEAEGGL